jgi:SAM-dependent methyltransferase
VREEDVMENLSMYPNAEMRQFKRKAYVKVVDYSVSSPESKEWKKNLKGKTLDISYAGLRIETDYPLAPGHMLWFDDEMKQGRGVVRWCMKLDDYYRAGIQLTDKARTREKDEDVAEDTLLIGADLRKCNELLDTAAERFNREMEALEQRCHDPNENPEELLQATERTIEEVLAVCAEFERGVKDKKIIRSARVSFHQKTNPILSKGYFVNRIRTWPQGSQGDYKTLEVLYKNTPLSEGVGYYLDLGAMNAALAVGVRNRIVQLQEILRDEIQKRQLPSIMNIGCGSCRELMGIAPEIIASEARIICIDNDDDALAFAQDRLAYAGILPQVELRKYNALRMFDDELNMMEFGKQDIVYSVGLFDYLPSDFLGKMLGSLYRLLNPGGKLIASFKDAARYRSQSYHWIGDWDGFLQRTEEDFRGILTEAGIPPEAIAETRETTGVIIFYVITRLPQMQS